ncbi:MAG: phosphate/phosphite/phosphonate ABC transporter substrate-binding protein [Candidatus Xenobia bacterium]
MLTVVSLLSEVFDPMLSRLVPVLSQRSGIPLRLEGEAPWQERQRMLRRGEAQVAWLCGLQYVRQHRELPLLAAPVMYADGPVYYTDVVVRADSPFTTLEHVCGARWVYNEPESYSGYVALLRHGIDLSAARPSGSHWQSRLEVLEGRADVAGIDSMILDGDPRLRVIARIGPSPAPPMIGPPELRAALLSLPPEVVHPLQRFVEVPESWYDPLRGL